MRAGFRFNRGFFGGGQAQSEKVALWTTVPGTSLAGDRPVDSCHGKIERLVLTVPEEQLLGVFVMEALSGLYCTDRTVQSYQRAGDRQRLLDEKSRYHRDETEQLLWLHTSTVAWSRSFCLYGFKNCPNHCSKARVNFWKLGCITCFYPSVKFSAFQT